MTTASTSKSDRQNNDEFLTTTKGVTDAVKQFEKFGDRPVILIEISMYLKEEGHGYLEEKRLWIHKVWKRIVDLCPNITGGRHSFDTIFFAVENDDEDSVRNKFIDIVRGETTEILEGICVADTVAGDAEAKRLAMYDLMEEVTTKAKYGGQSFFDYGPDYLDVAKQYWMNGIPDAGRIIFENIRKRERPLWACNVLRFVLSYFNFDMNHMDEISEIISDERRWADAPQLFHSIRTDTLAARDFLSNAILKLANNVAEVIYNSSPASQRVNKSSRELFKYDTGWWLATNLKAIINMTGSEDMNVKGWDVLCGKGNSREYL